MKIVKLFLDTRVAVFLLAGLAGTSSTWSQGSAPYANLVSISSSLTQDQKLKAAQLFSSGFSLWQGGDFQSALLAFKEGLEIDPANAHANFYYADCLRQTKQREQAVSYFERASALGAGSAEAFKAKAALSELAKPVPFSELSPSERVQFYEGIWVFEGYQDLVFTIAKDSTGRLSIDGEAKCFLCFSARFKDLTVLEDGSIRFGQTNPVTDKNYFKLRLVSPTRMEGTSNSPDAGQFNFPVAAVKK